MTFVPDKLNEIDLYEYQILKYNVNKILILTN